MDDYIKREYALKMKFRDGINDDGLLYVPYRDVLRHLQQLPAADVRENVHGEWIDAYDFWQCSVCKSTRLKQARSVYGDTFFITLKTNFCPDCGADMRGEKDV